MTSYLSRSSWLKNTTSVRTGGPVWQEHSNSRGWKSDTSSGSLASMTQGGEGGRESSASDQPGPSQLSVQGPHPRGWDTTPQLPPSPDPLQGCPTPLWASTSPCVSGASRLGDLPATMAQGPHEFSQQGGDGWLMGREGLAGALPLQEGGDAGSTPGGSPGIQP